MINNKQKETDFVPAVCTQCGAPLKVDPSAEKAMCPFCDTVKWTATEGVESYHVVVSAGSGSVLRFVNMDYKKYSEFDVKAKPGNMEYTFTYKDAIDPETGVKLKFEIYGIRHAANGAEQKSATTTETIVLSK